MFRFVCILYDIVLTELKIWKMLFLLLLLLSTIPSNILLIRDINTFLHAISETSVKSMFHIKPINSNNIKTYEGLAFFKKVLQFDDDDDDLLGCDNKQYGIWV